MTDNASPSPEIKTETLTVASQPTNEGSQIKGVSLRGIITILLVVTLCALEFIKVVPSETFSNITISVVSYYFGHAIATSKK